MDRWNSRVWASFKTGNTNAFTKSCNRKGKQVKRVACVFRNHNFVLRTQSRRPEALPSRQQADQAHTPAQRSRAL